MPSRSMPWLLLTLAITVVTSLHCARPPGPELARGPGEPVVAFIGVTLLTLDTGADRAGGSRGAAGAARVYEITPPRGPRSELITDADGWPMELAVVDHGAPLRLRRRP
jgi:hypothetical protein